VVDEPESFHSVSRCTRTSGGDARDQGHARHPDVSAGRFCVTELDGSEGRQSKIGQAGASEAHRQGVRPTALSEGGTAKTFWSDERAELIAALSRTAEMVGLLLDALDVLLVSYAAGQQPSAGDVEQLTEHSAVWRQQLEKLRSRLASLTIEPPTRVQ
jgi:hypothetical protein